MNRALLHYSIEHHNFHFKSELQRLGLFMAVRTFAISLISIFISIYFYKMGKSLPEIFLYDFAAYTSAASSQLLSVYIYRKIGPKKAICLSVPFMAFFLYLLATVTIFGWPTWFLGLVVGFSLALFWQPYHYLFSKFKNKNKAAAEVSHRFVAMALFGSVAPIIGAFLLTRFPSNLVFGISIILTLLSAFILMGGKDVRVMGDFDFRGIKPRKYGKEIISYSGYAIQEVGSMGVWPFAIFLIFGTYRAVGAFVAFTLIISIILTYLVAKSSDHGKREVYIRDGSILNFFINLGRMVAYSLSHVVVLNFLQSLAGAIFNSPFVSEYYLHADEEKRDEYIFLMEFFAEASRAVYFAILILVAIYLPVKTTLILALLLSGLGALLTGIMPPSKRELKMLNQNIKIMPRPSRVRIKV